MIPRSGLLVLAALAAPAIGFAQAAPSPEVLGVPAYPGATYDARMSAGLSQEREKYYVFTSPDSLARVVRFYENATHKRGAEMGGAVIIAIEGNPPFPQHGVLIEPNRTGMYPPSVRTVISVRRELPEPEGQQ